MSKSSIVFLLVFGLASLCHAETVMVPTWLPADQRFEVEGTSNEIAQVDHTLALMRDALHPKLKAQMKPEDLGPTLGWIVHVSLPGMTNEMAYFDSYKAPVDSAFFTIQSSFVLLTNRASRLSYAPPIVNLSLIYDDKMPDASSRTIPGVDYPGLAAEDVGTTPRRICLRLYAPKVSRRFVVVADTVMRKRADCQFEWVQLRGRAQCPNWLARTLSPSTEKRYLYVNRVVNLMDGGSIIAVFSRQKSGLWGPPSFIQIENDEYGCLRVVNRGLEIEYGNFKDYYDTDKKGNVCGFVRRRPGDIFGQQYSNLGEMIVETYSEDRPKTTRKVRYFAKEGKLDYEVLDEMVHYKNAVIECRSRKW